MRKCGRKKISKKWTLRYVPNCSWVLPPTSVFLLFFFSEAERKGVEVLCFPLLTDPQNQVLLGTSIAVLVSHRYLQIHQTFAERKCGKKTETEGTNSNTRTIGKGVNEFPWLKTFEARFWQQLPLKVFQAASLWKIYEKIPGSVPIVIEIKSPTSSQQNPLFGSHLRGMAGCS